jgi:hypothetical protein
MRWRIEAPTAREEDRMAVSGAGKRIVDAVSAWPGVVARPHRFGGTEFVVGKREVGHIHGDGLVDIAFPKAVRDDLVAAGLAEPHHILPESGWVSFHIRRDENVDAAIALLHRSYELAWEQQMRKHGREMTAHAS